MLPVATGMSFHQFASTPKVSTPVRAEIARGPWTAAESRALELSVQEHTMSNSQSWTEISRFMLSRYQVNRDATQCRHRWMKVQAPNIKKGIWEENEDKLLAEAVDGRLLFLFVDISIVLINF